jgi:hypothetical protein
VSWYWHFVDGVWVVVFTVVYVAGRQVEPPTRGLFRCAWRVRDGRLEVQAPHYPTLQDTLVKDDA